MFYESNKVFASQQGSFFHTCTLHIYGFFPSSAPELSVFPVEN
jgi:hypothetical protein